MNEETKRFHEQLIKITEDLLYNKSITNDEKQEALNVAGSNLLKCAAENVIGQDTDLTDYGFIMVHVDKIDDAANFLKENNCTDFKKTTGTAH